MTYSPSPRKCKISFSNILMTVSLSIEFLHNSLLESKTLCSFSILTAFSILEKYHASPILVLFLPNLFQCFYVYLFFNLLF